MSDTSPQRARTVAACIRFSVMGLTSLEHGRPPNKTGFHSQTTQPRLQINRYLFSKSSATKALYALSKDR
jgi:hypothetical protein